VVHRGAVLPLLYFQDVLPEADFTIKTTGYQWNWEYEYPDHGGFTFFANMVEDEDLDNAPLHRRTATSRRTCRWWCRPARRCALR
jgi:heme/copper-type cytochrome/quinol oxidase subunit 2